MSVYRKLFSELSYLTGKYLVKPEYISLITTFRCNLNCPACDIWRKPVLNSNQKKDFSDEFSIKEWFRIIDELKKSFPQNTFIEINGGEPIINKELVLKLIAELKEFFSQVVLNTNGTLINKMIVEQLESTGLDTIKLSFYSLDKDIHNRMRGSVSAYGKAKEAIDLILKSRINLEAAVLLTSQNIFEAPKLIEWLSRKGINIILQPLDEIIESRESKLIGNLLPADLWPDKNDIKKFFNWLKPRVNQLKIKNPLFLLRQIEKYYLNQESVLAYRCFAGQRNLVIYPNGEVAFCFKTDKIGSLRKQNLKNILKGKQSLIRRKKINNCQKYCRIIGCNFSRGIKEYFKDI